MIYISEPNLFFRIELTTKWKVRPNIIGECSERTLVFACFLYRFGNFLLNKIIQIKFLFQINFCRYITVETSVSKIILSFSMKI